MKMARFISGKKKCSAPISDDDYHSYLISRKMTSSRLATSGVRVRMLVR
jgi:hypothetical protein